MHGYNGMFTDYADAAAAAADSTSTNACTSGAYARPLCKGVAKMCSDE